MRKRTILFQLAICSLVALPTSNSQAQEELDTERSDAREAFHNEEIRRLHLEAERALEELNELNQQQEVLDEGESPFVRERLEDLKEDELPQRRPITIGWFINGELITLNTENPRDMSEEEMVVESIRLQERLGQLFNEEEEVDLPDHIKEKLNNRLDDLNQELQRRETEEKELAERLPRIIPVGFTSETPTNDRGIKNRTVELNSSRFRGRRIKKVRLLTPRRRPAIKEDIAEDPYSEQYPYLGRQTNDQVTSYPLPTSAQHNPQIYGKSIAKEATAVGSPVIYPNPAISSDALTIDQVQGLVEVFTLYGQKVWSANANGQVIVPAGTLSGGLTYFMRNETNTAQFVVH